MAVETLGVWGPGALELIGELGRRLAVSSHDPRATSFLKQRISIAIQRGNALAVMGTFPSSMAVGDFLLQGDDDP